MLRIWSSYFITPIYNEVYIFKDWYSLRCLRHFYLSGAVHVGSLNYLRQESALVRIILAAVWKIFLNTHWNWFNGPVFVLHFIKAS